MGLPSPQTGWASFLDSSDLNEATFPSSLAGMFGEADSRVRNMSQPSQSQSQSCLMSLEHLVRLLADCAPPVYLYFISVLSGGWEPHLVTRQIRNINLAEVVISHNQDLHSPSQVSLSLYPASSWLKMLSSLFRRELQQFQPEDNIELKDLTRL